MIRTLDHYTCARTNVKVTTVDELCAKLAASPPGTHTICEYLSAAFVSRTKVYFDIDNYLPYGAEFDKAYAKQQRNKFIQEIRLIFNLTGHIEPPKIVIAKRHRVKSDSVGERVKLSFRAWVTNYYIDDYNAISRVIVNFKKLGLIRNGTTDTDEGGLDSSPYKSSDQPMSCVYCRKDSSDPMDTFMRPESLKSWPPDEVAARLKDYLACHLNGSEMCCNFADHAPEVAEVPSSLPGASRAAPVDDESSYEFYTSFEFLEKLVMSLPSSFYGRGSHEEWLRVLFGVLHTGDRNGYFDEAADLCHRFSEQALYADGEKYVERIIDEYDERRASVTIATLMRYAQETECFAELAKERYKDFKASRRLWLFHRVVAAMAGEGAKVSFDDWCGPDRAGFIDSKGAAARHLGWSPATEGEESPVVVLGLDKRMNVVAEVEGVSERVVGDLRTARAHYMLEAALLAVAGQGSEAPRVGVKLGRRDAEVTAREAIVRALNTLSFDGDVLIPAALRKDPGLEAEVHDFRARLTNRRFTLEHLERLMPPDAMDAYRSAFALLAPPPPPASLHDPDVVWDEPYNEERMRACKLTSGITVICAPMGAGKTESLRQVISTLPAKATILSIVYNRALAHKFRDDFCDLGFRSYLDEDCPDIIMYERVVVCLDSMGRIDHASFDLVVIDEAMSLLQHFHSPLMDVNTKATVCNAFHVITTRSRRVLLMDAVADNQMVRMFVEELCKARARVPGADAAHSKAFWTINRHIRSPGKEKCSVFVNTSLRETRAHRNELFEAAFQLLLDGKRICMAVSSKSAVDDLRDAFNGREELKAKGVRAYFYTSDTPPEVMFQHMRNVNKTWVLLDFVVYSPAISSGMSFTVQHFDVRMAYFINDRGTPSVDMCIQQLYRVRTVREDRTIVYVTSTCTLKAPVHLWQVEKELARESDFLAELDVANGFPSGGLQLYAKNNIFYPILVGTLLNRGRSLMQFYPILRNSLVCDRGVELTESILVDDDEAITTPDAPAPRPKSVKRKDLISTTKVPSLYEYEAIRKEAEQVTLDITKRQLKLNYEACRLLGVEAQDATEDFIKRFVGPADAPHALDKVKATYFRFKWLAALLSVGDPKTFFSRKLWGVHSYLSADGTCNMGTFTDKCKAGMYKAAEAATVLAHIFPETDIGVELRAPASKLSAEPKVLAGRLDTYLESRGELLKFVANLFDFRGSLAKVREEVDATKVGASRPRIEFIKKIVTEGLGLELKGAHAAVVISRMRYTELMTVHHAKNCNLIVHVRATDDSIDESPLTCL